MSFIKVEETCEKIDNELSDEVLQEDSDDSYQTEEEIFNESFSDSTIKLENVSIKKNFKKSDEKSSKAKARSYRVNVSVRYGKHNCFFNRNKKSQRVSQRKICKRVPVNGNNFLEEQVETPKKGKRCRAGGKAKGNPPEEVTNAENNEKCESDEESENYFFSRISLGFFQKFRDFSGASTSNQEKENYKRPLPVNTNENMRDEIFEEMELLELQNWGMAKNEKLEKKEYFNPDTF